jgi:hypothetical protein
MDDRARVAQLLGREPRGVFDVVVRDDAGDPVVVRNAPFLDDGTPMPTRYYLVGADLVRDVSRLEAAGGVRDAEAELDPADVAAVHDRYARERDAAIPDDHVGPRPTGGVGGTRTGVKCLHAHVAYALAGGDDPVGRWALVRIHGDGGTGVPGGVIVDIADHEVVLRVTGGGSFTLPVGPVALLDGPLERADPPAPELLTNALGLVQDHVDDVLIAAPSLAAAPAVTIAGPHAVAMARVEIGADTVPPDYRLTRAAADEVFRTLAVEPIADRRHNPGLTDRHVESIIGTCCVILGVMRRLELSTVGIAATGHV